MMKKPKEQTVRGYMVDGEGAPVFYAGSSLEDLMRGLKQVGAIEDMEEGDEILIRIVKFTPSEIEKMAEL